VVEVEAAEEEVAEDDDDDDEGYEGQHGGGIRPWWALVTRAW
jgi:hypothetical protein